MRLASDEVSAEDSLKTRLRIEELISRIAMSAVRTRDVTAFVDDILSEIGTALNLSRVTIAELDWKQMRLTARYQWLAEGIRDSSKLWNSTYSSEISPIMRRPEGLALISGTPLVFEDVDAIGEAKYQEFLKLTETASIVFFPIMLGDDFYGVLNFESVGKQRKWDSRDIRILRVVAQLIGQVFERDRSQALLNESEARFRRIAESAPDVIFRMRHKPDHVIDYISPASAAVFGYTPDEILSNPGLVMERTHPDDRPLVARMMQSTISDSRTGSALVRFLHRDGSVVWCEIRYVDIFDEAGQLVASEGILRNVTERMNAEQELLRRKNTAEAASARAQTYLDFIAHDLTNILSPTMTHADLILASQGASPEVRNSAAKILMQAQRAATFIRNTRVLAESESNDVKRQEVGDLRVLLDEKEKELRLTHPQKRFLFTNNLPPDVPLNALGRRYISDIIEVILDNSATYDTSDEVRIDIEVEPSGGAESHLFWKVSLADHGPGIPDSAKKRLMIEAFDPSNRFTRGITTSLCFMSLIAEHIGGRLRIEDRVPGDYTKGTRFVLLFQKAGHSES